MDPSAVHPMQGETSTKFLELSESCFVFHHLKNILNVHLKVTFFLKKYAKEIEYCKNIAETENSYTQVYSKLRSR